MGGFRLVAVLLVLALPLLASGGAATHPCRSLGVSVPVVGPVPPGTMFYVWGCAGDHTENGRLDHVYLTVYTPVSDGGAQYADYREVGGDRRDISAWSYVYGSDGSPTGAGMYETCKDPDHDDACDRDTLILSARSDGTAKQVWVIHDAQAGTVVVCTDEPGASPECETLLS